MMTAHANNVSGKRPCAGGSCCSIITWSHDTSGCTVHMKGCGAMEFQHSSANTHTHTGKLRGTHCENISFLYVMGVLCSLCDRFQSERESGDRNFAIGYYLKEKKVWPWMSHEALLTLFLCLLMFCCPTKLKGNNCEQDEVCVCKRRSWLLRHQCFCWHQ